MVKIKCDSLEEIVKANKREIAGIKYILNVREPSSDDSILSEA